MNRGLTFNCFVVSIENQIGPSVHSGRLFQTYNRDIYTTKAVVTNRPVDRSLDRLSWQCVFVHCALGQCLKARGHLNCRPHGHDNKSASTCFLLKSRPWLSGSEALWSLLLCLSPHFLNVVRLNKYRADTIKMDHRGTQTYKKLQNSGQRLQDCKSCMNLNHACQ